MTVNLYCAGKPGDAGDVNTMDPGCYCVHYVQDSHQSSLLSQRRAVRKRKKKPSAPWTIANSTTHRTAGTQSLRPTLGPRLGKVWEEFIRLRVTRRAGPAGRFDCNMHVSQPPPQSLATVLATVAQR